MRTTKGSTKPALLAMNFRTELIVAGTDRSSLSSVEVIYEGPNSVGLNLDFFVGDIVCFVFGFVGTEVCFVWFKLRAVDSSALSVSSSC